jgi:hypothetical protein
MLLHVGKFYILEVERGQVGQDVGQGGGQWRTGDDVTVKTLERTNDIESIRQIFTHTMVKFTTLTFCGQISSQQIS